MTLTVDQAEANALSVTDNCRGRIDDGLNSNLSVRFPTVTFDPHSAGPISGSHVDELVRNQSLGATLMSRLGTRECARGSMTQSIYNIVKTPSGWFVYCDGAKTGGTYGSKEAALEAAAVAAALAARDGRAIQIYVPGAAEETVC
jgi:hypothetical protein